MMNSCNCKSSSGNGANDCIAMRSNSDDAFTQSQLRPSPSESRSLSTSEKQNDKGQDRSNIMKQKVLFICVHNSARSQMAEGFLNKICGDQFEAHSAGLEPGRLNPLALEAMREIGIDISRKQTQSVFDVFKSGELFAYVITVCDESNAGRCPIFAGVTKRLHWSFPDPAALSGTREERLAGTRKIRDQIRARIEMWCDEICPVEVGAADWV